MWWLRLSAMPRICHLPRPGTLRTAIWFWPKIPARRASCWTGTGLAVAAVVLRCQRAGACREAAALLRTGASIGCSPRRNAHGVRSGLPGRARGRCCGRGGWLPVPGPRRCWAALVAPACPLIASSSWGFPAQTARARPARSTCFSSCHLSSSNRPSSRSDTELTCVARLGVKARPACVAAATNDHEEFAAGGTLAELDGSATPAASAGESTLVVGRRVRGRTRKAHGHARRGRFARALPRSPASAWSRRHAADALASETGRPAARDLSAGCWICGARVVGEAEARKPRRRRLEEPPRVRVLDAIAPAGHDVTTRMHGQTRP